jgi:hypothetical protein
LPTDQTKTKDPVPARADGSTRFISFWECASVFRYSSKVICKRFHMWDGQHYLHTSPAGMYISVPIPRDSEWSRSGVERRTGPSLCTERHGFGQNQLFRYVSRQLWRSCAVCLNMISKMMKAYWARMPEEEKAQRLTNLRAAQAVWWEQLPEEKKSRRTRRGE